MFLSLLLLLLHFLTYGSQPCLSETLRVLNIWVESGLDNTIFDTLDLTDVHATSLSRCILSCSQDARCVSVLYQESRGQCRLQGGRFYLTQGGRGEQGWRYFLLEMDPRCPVKSGYIHRRDLSLCYRLEFQVGARHSEAVSNCTQEGGHLLRIDSQEKQDHIAQQLNSSRTTSEDFVRPENGQHGYYIDGERIKGTWTWPSVGQEMTYFSWHPDESQKRRYSYKQDYAIVGNEQNWQWCSVEGKHIRAYICEISI